MGMRLVRPRPDRARRVGGRESLRIVASLNTASLRLVASLNTGSLRIVASLNPESLHIVAGLNPREGPAMGPACRPQFRPSTASRSRWPPGLSGLKWRRA
ncbi:MAG: hypothetical protein JO042_08945 [Sinobacteraceae bacterium]|nr:hypothetical protein [Nevskiaceae bacterium]